MELVQAGFSTPVLSLVIAFIAAAGILLFASRSHADIAATEAPSLQRRYTPERRALGVVAVLVIVMFLAELIVRGYVYTGSGILYWWRYAIPIGTAAVGLGVVFGLVVTRGSTAPEIPVMSGTRRSWTSFSSRTGIVAATAVALGLILTTVLAGVASAIDGEGQYVWLAIPIPNEPAIDPIRLPFYGWSYGVPVLICLTVLLVIVWTTLERNAARPFLRPEAVVSERAARRSSAAAVTSIATAAMLLTLAGAWRLIASAGSGSSLTVMGQNGDNPYDAAWRYAELAIAAGWCAPILEIIGFTLLLIAAANGLRRARGAHATVVDGSDVPTRAEAML